MASSEPRKAIFEEWYSIAAHEALGTTIGFALAENARIALRRTLLADAKSPLLKAGWPQHVWSSGRATAAPKCLRI